MRLEGIKEHSFRCSSVGILMPQQIEIGRTHPFFWRESPQSPFIQVVLNTVFGQTADAKPGNQKSLDLIVMG